MFLLTLVELGTGLAFLGAGALAWVVWSRCFDKNERGVKDESQRCSERN